jgi:putative ATP-grasp target RiPP
MIAILGDDPLSSVGVRRTPPTGEPSSATSYLATRPLVLRGVRSVPDRVVPEYVYDPQRQIATDPAGHPLGPNLKKDWTTIEGTHTDGDGGDNESWSWEEV